MDKKEIETFLDAFLRSAGTKDTVISRYGEEFEMIRGILCHSHGTELLESSKLDANGQLLYLGRPMTDEEKLCLEFLDSFLMRVHDEAE